MRGVVLLFLLLLLVPASSAAWERGSLESVAVRDASLAGTATVVQVVGVAEGVTPQMSLRGERILVDEWWKYQEFDNGIASISSTPQTGNDPHMWNHTTVVLKEVRPELILFLEASSEVRLEDTRMVVGGHLREVVTESSTSGHHRPPSEVTVSALHEVGATQGTLVLTGDFALSLYDGDLRFQNKTDTRTYWSGTRNETGPLSPAVDGSRMQRLYLDVTNGTLTLPLTGLDVRDLFVAGTTLAAASAVLDLASGDTPLSLAGPLQFALEPVSGGTFPGRVVPPGTAPSAGPAVLPGTGSPEPATTATNGVGGLWTSLVVVLALALAGVFAGRGLLRLLRLRRARDDGDYGSVASGAGLENSRRFGAEVVVARVVCMVKTGQFAAAASLLEKRGDRLAPAVCAYLWACVHAGAGAVEDAREAVVRSVLADPGMAVEVASNKSLRRFLADVGEGGYS